MAVSAHRFLIKGKMEEQRRKILLVDVEPSIRDSLR